MTPQTVPGAFGAYSSPCIPICEKLYSRSIGLWRFLFASARLLRKSVRLPVEAGPQHVDAIGDPLELVAAVAVSRPQVVQRGELGQVGEPVLRGLGHVPLPGQEAAVAFGRMDAESFRRLLRDEAPAPARRQ